MHINSHAKFIERYERKNENIEVKALRLLISFFILQF